MRCRLVRVSVRVRARVGIGVRVRVRVGGRVIVRARARARVRLTFVGGRVVPRVEELLGHPDPLLARENHPGVLAARPSGDVDEVRRLKARLLEAACGGQYPEGRDQASAALGARSVVVVRLHLLSEARPTKDRPEWRRAGFEQASPAPEAARGSTWVRPASANQPLGPHWPAIPTMLST